MKAFERVKFQLPIVMLIAALVASVCWLSYVLFYPKSSNLIDAKIGNTSIKLEEAKTEQEQELGLGNRKSLDANTGMLFRFSSPKIATFWMKGMKFPLDFIWIRENKVVELDEYIAAPISILSDTKLPLISPSVDVDSVIEVNAGFVEYNKIKVGEEVKMMNLK
jgi:uncharacterized membrane protein (UPF0127 family)